MIEVGRARPAPGCGATGGRTGGSSGARRHEWRLPAAESSIPSLRRGLWAVLDGTGSPADQLYDLVLVACEAATNAIEHAQHPTEPFVDVVFEIEDDQVTIVVRDHGQWRDGPSGPHRGRGLVLMRALADTTVTRLPKGTTVTIRHSTPGSGPDGRAMCSREG